MTVACLCLLASLASATDWMPRAESARFQRLGTERGLSQSSVMAMAQDRRGRLWVGTQAGLNRFDGSDVTVFRPQPGAEESLSDNYVTSIVVDRDGAVWVGTLDGLNRVDPDTGHFTIFRHRADDAGSVAASRIAALHVDMRGTLWVGSERGLSRWDPGRGRFDNWSRAAGNAAALPDDRIVALASDAAGRLLVGSVRGVVRFEPDLQAFERIEPGGVDGGIEVTAVMVDREQRVWIATDGDGVLVGSADLDEWTALTVAADPARGLSSNAARSLLQDSAGRVWIGTDLGLDLLDPATLAAPQVAHFRHHRYDIDGIGGGRVASLFETADGSIWAGTWNGGASWISRERNRFESFSPDLQVTSGFRNPSSIALATIGETLWIGSGEGLYRFDTRNYRLSAAVDRDTTTYFGARVASEGLWLGSSRGLRIVDPATGQGREPELPGPLANGRVRRLWIDPDRVWLASDPLGLAVLDRELLAQQQLHPISRSVTFIKPLGDGLRLVGAYDGLYWFDAGSGELLHAHRLLTDARVADGLGAAPMDFAVGGDGRLWLATNGAGLREMRLDDLRDPASARFIPFDEKDGLGNPALKAMQVDARGVLWLSTASGIAAFDPATGRFTNFGRADGALGHDYINGSSAAFADGRLAFGGMDGFTLFDPAGIPLGPPPAPPAPLLTGIELGGGAAGADGISIGSTVEAASDDGVPLRLRAGSARSLALRFASPDYVRAAQLRYQYRLEGFDPGWVEVASNRRIAPYTNLAPGSYTFNVRAAYDESEWSPVSALDFVIEPFWWQTWWASALALLLGVSLLALGYHLRLRHAAALQAELTRQVAERTAALEEAKGNAESALRQLESTQQELVQAEKMAALGQLVAGVAHEVNTPIGVALTASSYVSDAAVRIGRSAAEGTLKRSELNGFIENVSESNLMIQRNLDRAAQLITNFKQVSVDRSSDGRRRFELGAYLDELLQSLQLMWKRQSIEVRVECPPGIVLDSFPGALGQIITNLMQNSVRHGFAGQGGGHMSLLVRRIDAQHIEIRQSDDGVGIPPEHIGQIFDPFFTTQRNQGGTGLGLHIVFNLVTQKLGGTISVRSEPDQGATFVLVLPVVAPN